MKRTKSFTSLSSKKGQLTIPLIVIGIILVGFLVYMLAVGVGNGLLQDLNDQIQDDDSFSDTAKNPLQTLSERNHLAWDNGFIFLAGFMLLAAFLAGATIQQSPVVLIIVIITMFLTTYIGMNIVNFYEDITIDTSDDIDFSTYYPKASFIMNNLALYIIGAVTLFGIGIWASERIGL